MDRFREVAMRRRALVPYEFPFIVPTVMYTGMLLVVGAAVVQRDFTRPWLLVLACALSLGPILIFLIGGHRFGSLLTAGSMIAGVAVFLTWPPIFNDAAPFLLMFMAGEIVALSSLTVGLVVTAASALLLFVASACGHLSTYLPYLMFFLAVGALMGRILQLQQRLLLQERAQQATLAQQAAGEERRRIAREVHDVIAHSLSVTMLHLTGARRALQEDRDVDDAVAGLVDAERLGRQAMSDIRRTVGLLGAGPDRQEAVRLTPEPGLADIPELVSGFSSAGLNVEVQIDGDTDSVSGGVGLALYRVAQESLANIAKHAPQSAATGRLDIGVGNATLLVRNDLPNGYVPQQSSGSGLSGMRQRIEALGGRFDAGPESGRWTVRADVPIGPNRQSRPESWKLVHRNV